MGKSDSLVFEVNRAKLSGPKSYQYRIRTNAHRFIHFLRRAKYGVQKWTKISNRHFKAVADEMKNEGLTDGRIAEVFSAARHLCVVYENMSVSSTNADFDVSRGSITNQTSKAADPEVVSTLISTLENVDPYLHAQRVAAQVRLQYELGLRREEASKLDLVNDWNRDKRTLEVRYGTKGGRPRTLHGLSAKQTEALEKALPFVSKSNRPGIYNLMPEGMGDRWQNCLDYVAKKYGLTKKVLGYTLHGNRHERFRQMYVDIAGFEPPNRFDAVATFQRNAESIAGDDWPTLDDRARDEIEVTAGHSAGRRDVSNAYLGSSY